MDNRKPKEELDSIIQDIDNPPTEEETEDEPISDTIGDEPEAPVEEETVETIVEDEEPEAEDPKPTPKKKVEQKLEDRYKASTQEANALYFRNQEMTDTINEAANMPDPTIEQLRAYASEQGANYDELDPFMQNMVKKTLKNELGMDKIKSIAVKDQQLTAWKTSVEEFAGDDEVLNKFPSLADHTQEFIDYCMKKNRRGMDLVDLVGSFMFGVEPKAPGKSLFNSRSNSEAAPAPKTGLQVEEVIQKRRRSQKDYMRSIRDAAAKKKHLYDVE